MCTLLRSKGVREGILRGITVEVGCFRMQRDQLPSAVCQDEEVAARKPPQFLGRILDSDRVIGGHKCLQDRQVGEQFCRMGKRLFAELLNVSECIYRVVEILKDLQANLLLGSLTGDKQRARSEPDADQDQREQEFRP